MEKIDLLLLLDYFNTHPLSPRKYSGLCFVLLGLWVGKIDNYCYKTYFMSARVTMAEPLTFACFQLASNMECYTLGTLHLSLGICCSVMLPSSIFKIIEKIQASQF